ncbi:MAG: hypothetical protein MUO76_04505 [Anaerolineaceae bacterium]|nr:hypothetical protein [Anaerolineaceae bacterium]
MPQRSSPVRVRSNRMVKKGKNVFRIDKDEHKPVSGRQQIHPAELFRGGSVDRVADSRFGMNARHTAALSLGETIGNRNLQRHLEKPSTPDKGIVQKRIIQRGLLSSIKDWFKKKFGMDPKGAMKKLDYELQFVCDVIDDTLADKGSHPEMRKKLLLVKKNLGLLKMKTPGILKVLDKRDKVRKLWSFVDALHAVPDSEGIVKDPAKAAKAFGELFSAAGELGDKLPTGPWTPYFKFLKGFTNFFSDMRYGLVPELKPMARGYEKYMPK